MGDRIRRPSQRVLIQGQQVVVPVPIRMSAKIRGVTSRADDADVRALAVARIDDKESVGFRVDARDDLLPAPIPVGFGVSETSNMLMRALRMRFGDARLCKC